MNQGDIPQMESIAPENTCPYLPPFPLGNKITGQLKGFMYQPCLEKTCAIYSSCRGESSPAHLAAVADARYRSSLELVSEVLAACGSLPMIGTVMTVAATRLKERLSQLPLPLSPRSQDGSSNGLNSAKDTVSAKPS